MPKNINARIRDNNPDDERLFKAFEDLRKRTRYTDTSGFLRDLLAELLLPGKGTRIISQLDLSALGFAHGGPDPVVELKLDQLHGQLLELRGLVKSNGDFIGSLAIGALVEFANMDAEDATALVRDLATKTSEPD